MVERLAMGSAYLANYRLHIIQGACMSNNHIESSPRLNDGLHSLYSRNYNWASESTT